MTSAALPVARRSIHLFRESGMFAMDVLEERQLRLGQNSAIGFLVARTVRPGDEVEQLGIDVFGLVDHELDDLRQRKLATEFHLRARRNAFVEKGAQCAIHSGCPVSIRTEFGSRVLQTLSEVRGSDA